MERLKSILQHIDGKGYKAYKKTEGIYQFPDFSLKIDHVQGDPFAIPSRMSVRVTQLRAGFPLSSWTIENNNPIRRIALEDYLGRMVKKNIRHIIKGQRGSGGGGIISIETNGQKTLLRNAVLITTEYIEVRLVMGLPADNRHVAGLDAQQMFFDELPVIIEQSLYYKNCSAQLLTEYVNSAEDQEALRHSLKEKKLVAFIANGSLLPRQSGICDKPMLGNIISFHSPASLEFKMTLPNAGIIRGMGIPQGISLIVGGGFHGKSTLLNALEHGPYNHIPGDGREKVVSNETAVKIRSEDGRAISKVNISPFIDRLPFGRDTHQFSTTNASGSTSQAANIIEALECGSELFLIDEDTSANNFMIRDQRMQALVSQDKEPITPLLCRARELYEKQGVSSIIVMGGSGDYFDIADTVIMMDEYRARDVTAQAKKLAYGHQLHLSTKELINLPPFQRTSHRKPGKKTLDASRDQFPVRINVRESDTILYGEYKIDLSQVEQLVDIGQTRAIGLMIHYYACHYSHTSGNLTDQLKKLLQQANEKGLDTFSPYTVGDLALPRLYELAAAINRIRSNDWI
ncbi:MAG: ABC-ATPase domain-containing protein [gamma proteobacterium symbiont of Taylorina sp.]|nr:ABC-ATPase domain-containing protein [gamma proteobacterium symbiont of Taylorina sp.]